MTQLVEDITIKITLNHCASGDSTVLGGKTDLRELASKLLTALLPQWQERRIMHEKHSGGPIEIEFTNTGLYEVPELGGGDN